MSKSSNKPQVVEIVNTFSVAAHLTNVLAIQAGELRDEIEEAFNAGVFEDTQTNEERAAISMQHVLDKFGLVRVELGNARTAATAVICRPSDQTLGKERWLTYNNLFSAHQMPNNVVVIVAKPSYLANKISGYEVAAKSSKEAPKLASLAK